MDRNEEKLNSIIVEYLKRKSCYLEDAPWIVKKSPLGEFGVFAKRNIQPGEIIFIDFPVLLGPRNLLDLPVQCSLCYSKANLSPCDKDCNLIICGACSMSGKHLTECQFFRKFKKSREFTDTDKENLTKCLTPLRSLMLCKEDVEIVTNLKSHSGSQHGREVNVLTENLGLDISNEEKKFLYFVCTVLDANAFEVLTDIKDNMVSIRGLFPLGGLANHRCFSNIFHVFDEQHKMIVRASIFIEENTEIFHSYTRLLWGTSVRMYHLKRTKHFECKCERCLDPTEFGTYLDAIYCKKCKGNVLPRNPLKRSNWYCDTCNSMESPQDVGKTLTLIGSVMKGFSNDDFKIMYSFLTKQVSSLLPETNQAAVELKYRIIWMLGYNKGYLWKEMPCDLLLTKKQFCKDILELVEKLRLGKCKIRGLLLYELYVCTEEMKLRENNNQGDILYNDSNKYLLEAADILRYDASAPAILKQAIGNLKNYDKF